uniref:CSON000889 protein n=1 Tax=Culicoides sonorensis TaxID=179676 RepID=A0A336MFL4_CULSO
MMVYLVQEAHLDNQDLKEKEEKRVCVVHKVYLVQ